MAGNRAVRFVVLSPTGPRQLFTIRERNNGDLVLTFVNNITVTRKGREVRVNEDRISLHVSPKSDGHLIKSTTVLEDGAAFTGTQFVKPPKERFLAHVCSRLCSDLLDKAYDFKSKSKDEVLIVSFEPPSICSIAYHIIAGRPDMVYPELTWCRLLVHRASTFSVAVYITHVTCLPSHRTQIVFPKTAATQISGQAFGPTTTYEGVDVLPVDSLETWVFLTSDRLFYSRMEYDAKSKGIPFSTIENTSAQYFRFPPRAGETVISNDIEVKPVSNRYLFNNADMWNLDVTSNT